VHCLAADTHPAGKDESTVSSALDSVGGRLAAGTLSLEDARALWTTTDLVGVGLLADEVRRKRHGDRTTFVRVAEIPLADAESAVLPPAAGELRLRGAPRDLAEGVAVLRTAVARANGTPVTAFSLADLEGLTGGGQALVDYLRQLADEGLAAIADAPIDLLRDPRGTLEAVVAAEAHLGRCTADRIGGEADPPGIVQTVRALQKATGAIRVFAPLPRQIDTTRPSTGYDDVKLVALSRLLLDNVVSIQVDWARDGPKLAQVALLFGADDVDGVSPFDETGEGRRRSPLEEIRRNIQAASLTAVERDGRFAVRE
jgi:aminodeoxyfutalosine synthase